jgi:preprotein translocase subunit YajC
MNNNGAFSLLIFALPLLLLGWLFFTQNKRMRQMREFSSSLDVGDQVVTSSGIFGTVKHLDDSSAWLEIAEGTTVRFDRRAVAMKQSDTASSAGTRATGATVTGTAVTGATDPEVDAVPDDAPGTTAGPQQNGQ